MDGEGAQILAQGTIGRVEADPRGRVTLTLGYVTLNLGDEGLLALSQTLAAAVQARRQVDLRAREDLRLRLGGQQA